VAGTLNGQDAVNGYGAVMIEAVANADRYLGAESPFTVDVIALGGTLCKREGLVPPEVLALLWTGSVVARVEAYPRRQQGDFGVLFGE
jgi:hypothetical protein